LSFIDGSDDYVGGVREAFFSNEYYELVWGKRTGFAKVATEAQVVITCSSCVFTTEMCFSATQLIFFSSHSIVFSLWQL